MRPLFVDALAPKEIRMLCGRVVVRERSGDRAELASFDVQKPKAQYDSIAVSGRNGWMSFEAKNFLNAFGIPVYWLDVDGKLLGVDVPNSANASDRRQAFQFAASQDAELRLQTAKSIIGTKLLLDGDDEKLVFSQPRALAAHMADKHPASKESKAAQAAVKLKDEQLTELEKKASGLTAEKSILQSAVAQIPALQQQLAEQQALVTQMKPAYDESLKEPTAEEKISQIVQVMQDDEQLASGVMEHLGLEQVPDEPEPDAEPESLASKADTAANELSDKLREAIKFYLFDKPWQSVAELSKLLAPFEGAEIAHELSIMVREGELKSKQGPHSKGQIRVYALTEPSV